MHAEKCSLFIQQNIALGKRYLCNNKAKITLSLMLMLWLIDVFYVEHTWPDERKKSSSKALEDPKSVKFSKQVTLPPLPREFASTPRRPSKPIEMRAQKPLHVSSVEPFIETEDIVSVPKSAETISTETISTETISTETISTETIKSVLSQMTAMDGHSIRFLLPHAPSAKEHFLRHMYQCENMQFGAVSAQKPFRLTVLSNKADPGFTPSQLLRVAHDYLNHHEHNLLQVYAKNSQAVRIFPAEIDIVLARKIAFTLQGKALQQFSARYFISGASVGLRDININEQMISESWILSSGHC